MLQIGVITAEDKPTAWVNSMIYPIKSNGDLQLFVNPKDLYKAILREHYKAPTLEEITNNLAGEKVFSKLHAKNGFWSIK